MIQRVQSILLLLATVATASLFAFAFANIGDVSQAAGSEALSDGDFDIMDNIALTILAPLAAFVAFVNIFFFKNRKLQLSLNKLGVVLNLVLGGLAIFLLIQEVQKFNIDYAFNIGVGLPLVAIIFTLLASRFIKKDDKLVKSMDRLR